MRESILIDGKEFRSIKEACHYYNINYQTVISRVRSGMPIELAVKFKPDERLQHSRKPKKIIIDGIEFRSLSEASRYYSISLSMLSRKLGEGYTPEEAIIKDAKVSKPVVVGGVWYSSIAKASNYYGLDDRLVRARLRNGWSVEEAFGLIERGK